MGLKSKQHKIPLREALAARRASADVAMAILRAALVKRLEVEDFGRNRQQPSDEAGAIARLL